MWLSIQQVKQSLTGLGFFLGSYNIQFLKILDSGFGYRYLIFKLTIKFYIIQAVKTCKRLAQSTFTPTINTTCLKKYHSSKTMLVQYNTSLDNLPGYI